MNWRATSRRPAPPLNDATIGPTERKTTSPNSRVGTSFAEGSLRQSTSESRRRIPTGHRRRQLLILIEGDKYMFGRRTGTEGRTGRETHHRRRGHFGSHPRVATALGSAVGAVIVLAAAGALGIGAVGFATSIAVGMALGGWAGGEVSERRARKRAPREALRRRRSIRIFRITRTLRRRRLNRARPSRPANRIYGLVRAPHES
jgi:hypothetical protein